MQPLTQKIDNFGYLSQLFSAPNFDRIIRDNDKASFKRRIKKHYPSLKVNSTYKTVLSFLYSELQTKYRSEYLFKNTLLNKLLLEKYSLKTTTVLNEFAIGNSIADFVLLNGESRIYEIKTDLDGLDKLKKQISDYLKFSNKVFIVTTPKHSGKIMQEYHNTTVGVIEFTANNSLKELKPAESNSECFDTTILFKTLRKQEYIDIIRNYFGSTPQVPNTLLFKTCLKMAGEIKPEIFQSLVYTKLKERKIKCPDHLKSSKTPYALKHICYTLDMSELEYSKFYNFLNTNV